MNFLPALHYYDIPYTVMKPISLSIVLINTVLINTVLINTVYFIILYYYGIL